MRGEDGSWLPALEPEDIERGSTTTFAILGWSARRRQHANDGHVHSPAEGSIEKQVSALAELQRQGLVRHIGLANATSAQVSEAQSIAKIVCVQNHYNLVQRDDDTLVDELAAQGIAYVPFFPLGGFTPIQSSVLSQVAERDRRDADAGGARLAASSRSEHPAHPGHFLARPPA